METPTGEPAQAGGILPPEPATPTFLERRGISPTAFGFLCVIFFFVIYQVAGSALSVVIFGLSPDLTEPGKFRIFQGLSQVALLLVPALLVVRLATREPEKFLRVRAPSAAELFVPLVGILSLQQMLQVYMALQGMIPLPPEVERIVREMKEMIDQALLSLLGASSFPEFLGVVAVIAVIPGIAEELVFRGVVQRSFEKGVGPARGIAVTGLVFAAFHLNPFSLIPLAALGVYLGFLAWRADSIWVSIAAHFFNNLIPIAALYFGIADESVVTGDVEDMPFGILMAIFWFSGVIFLLSTYYFLHVTKKSAAARAAEAP